MHFQRDDHTFREALRVEQEGVFLPSERWHEAPPVVQHNAEESRAYGTPTAIVKDAKLGWCVLWTSGQGPGFVYVEAYEQSEEAQAEETP